MYLNLCDKVQKCFCNFQVFVLDELFFSRLLPLYKERVRGPALPFEYLEEELKSKRGWPPIGDCKNNEIKIGKYCIKLLK